MIGGWRLADLMCSHNEVGSLLYKAAVGAGYPVGIAEEVGRAGGWLSARGVDGVRAVRLALDGDAADRSVLQREVAGLDRFFVAADRPARLMAGSPQILLAGLAAVMLPATVACVRLLFANGGVAAVSRGDLFGMGGDLPFDAGEVSVVALASVPSAPACPFQPRIAVREADWRALSAWAARTYVPESEVSRAVGAGAGVTDND